MMRWFLKLLNWFISLSVGLFVALAIVTGSAIVAIRYVVAQIALDPPRPTFSNEGTAPITLTGSARKNSVARAPEPDTPAPQPSPLPSGTYAARVTQPIGLVLRAEPRRSSARIGGVYYNDRVLVLGKSEDGRWQRIRVGENGPDAWVVSGNTEATDG